MALRRILGVMALLLAACTSGSEVVESANSDDAPAELDSADELTAVADDSAPVAGQPQEQLSTLVQNETLLGTGWVVASSEPISDEITQLTFEGSRADAMLTVDTSCGQVELLLEPIPYLHKFNVLHTSWDECTDGPIRDWLDTEQITVAFHNDDVSATFVSNEAPTEIELLDIERSFTVSDGIPVFSLEDPDAQDQDQPVDFEPLPELTDEVLAAEPLIAGMHSTAEMIEGGEFLALIAGAQYIVVDEPGVPATFGEAPFDKLTITLQAWHGEFEPVVYMVNIARFSHIDPNYGPQTDNCEGGYALGVFDRQSIDQFVFNQNAIPDVFDNRIFFGDYECGSTPEIVPTFMETAITLTPADGGDLLLTTATGEELHLELVPLR